MTLPRDIRLKNKADFSRVFKRGKSAKGNFLFIKFEKNEVGNYRVGIVVSRKVSQKSTERNKIKRIISEMFKIFKEEVSDGIDIVIIADPKIKNASSQEIKEDLSKLIKKLI